VILGSGDIGMIMARRLHLEGCAVKAVVEIQSSIGGLTRNLVQCLHDFDIPLFLSHTIADIHGQQRVERVDIAPVNGTGEPDLSRAFSIDCDTLLLSVGLIPENELSKQAGILIDPATGGPVVDQHFQTSVPGIFAAGNVVQVFDLVDHVSICGMEAGKAAAEYARDGTLGDEVATILPGEGVRCVVPQRIRGKWDGELSFYMRAKEVRRRVTLQLLDEGGDARFEQRLRIVRPPEMIKVSVDNSGRDLSGSLTFRLTGGTP
jgi:NADPH-dependent 2,4-dienoyl-CoA reductase/sulfur reductase-like enzyme